jgi:CBS domain-containing protein
MQPGLMPAPASGGVPFGEDAKGMDLARNLKIESVSRLQPPPPLTLSPQHTIRQAVAAMQAQRVGCVLVCDGPQLVGIFTERDLLKRVVAAGKPLSFSLKECMTPHPVTVQLKESVGTALRRMQEGGYRHLPVVDEAGRPVGMLSVKRLMRYVVEHFPSTVYNLPPDPDVIQQEREGA